MLANLKRLMAERDAHDEGSPSFLVKNLGLGLEANRALPSLIAAAEAAMIDHCACGYMSRYPICDKCGALIPRSGALRAALAPLTKEVPHE